MIGEWFVSIFLNGGDYLRIDVRIVYLLVMIDFIVMMGFIEYQDGKYNYVFLKGFFEVVEGVVVSGIVWERNGGMSIVMYYINGIDWYGFDVDLVSSLIGVFFVFDGGFILFLVNDLLIN